jgi:hypothetical protein
MLLRRRVRIMANKKMSDSELSAIIDAQLRSSMGYLSGDLTSQRSKAMDYYLGEPFGNEVEGRSKVVSTDVADVVEWMVPSLMRTFTATDDAVCFDPVTLDDTEAAAQETDYVNHVFFKENPGFIILYTWIKDALLQKNGIVKTYWDETKEETREEYENLTEDEFAYISQDTELQAIEHTEKQSIEMVPVPTPDGQIVEQPVPQTTHDVVFKRTRIKGQVKVINIPPENYYIVKNHPSIDIKDASFVAHDSDMTESDLREMGIDDETIGKLPDWNDEKTSEERVARENLKEETNDFSNRTMSDKTMRVIRVFECYVRVDYDNDGIAELRKVTKAGNTILMNEEVDFIPFTVWTPVILTHKHFGLSIADLVMDLQLIKSTLLRNIMDNIYHINNSRHAVNENMVQLDDLLVSRPGGVVRCNGDPSTAIVPIVTQPLGDTTYQMMEYIDKIREGRAGISQMSMGLNDDLLNNNKGDQSVQRVMTAAEQRVELIARIFAETGFKPLMLRVHELLQKHQDKEKVVQLRGKWVQVNPQEWHERTDMTVNVGLANGERQQLVQSMNGIIAMQREAIAAGGLGSFVSLKNVYRAATDMSKYAGVRNPELYFTNPESDEAKAAMAKQQQDAEKAKAEDPNALYVKVEAQKNALEHQRAMFDLQQKEKNMNEEMQRKIAELSSNYESKLNDQALKLTELELKYSLPPKQNVNIPGSLV